jgi:hypothetical protein
VAGFTGIQIILQALTLHTEVLDNAHALVDQFFCLGIDVRYADADMVAAFPVGQHFTARNGIFGMEHFHLEIAEI